MARELTQKPKNGYTILIIDDDVQILSMYVSILKNEGYEVISTPKSEEAVDILKDNNIDIILLDYFMNEGTTAEESINAIRKFNNEVVIILQTGYSGKIPALEMLNKLDVQGYFNKTDGIERLLLTILSATKYIKQHKQVIDKN